MFAAQPSGTSTAREPARSYGHLVPGTTYEVRKTFVDYEGVQHLAGERWVYRSYGLLPYEDGLSLLVSLDGVNEWHIRLQDRPEEQGAIIHALADHVMESTALLAAVGTPWTADSCAASSVPVLSRALRWGWRRWMTTCASIGGVVGAMGGLFLAFAAGPDAHVDGAALEALGALIGGRTVIVLLFALPFALIGLFLGHRMWGMHQWQALCALMPRGTASAVIESLLGAPTGRIELFPDGSAKVLTWLYEPALYAPAGFSASIVCDFDNQHRLIAMRRLK